MAGAKIRSNQTGKLQSTDSTNTGNVDWVNTHAHSYSPRMWVMTLCVLHVLVAQHVSCFNVDTRTAVVQSGVAGSMFGFSVAQHKENGTNWLLVGAPKAQTTQTQVLEGGAVYRCPIDASKPCQQVVFDSSGNNNKWNGSAYVQVEDKSHQWFGATLKTSGLQDGVVVACAPRYVYFTREYVKREPVGQCFVKSAGNRARLYSPCKLDVDADTIKFRGHLTAFNFGRGHCQAGLSATLSADGQTLFMGAPGSYYWQGQVFSQNLSNFDNYYETTEAPATYDDTYMGYAIASGEFNGDNKTDIAVGIPKASGMKGRVAILNHELQSLYNVSGEQYGEYFGSSIAVGDFNGDRMDDMAVGAPFHTDNFADAFENGKVYVFYQVKQAPFSSKVTHLTGASKLRSRFGFAVASLKDINEDYYDDLAVGAPYDGDDGRGAVYIFHGSSSGILPTISQVIQARDVATGLATFGYSLAAGLDQDGNLYPDVLVGAYGSDKVAFLRSRPIVRVEVQMNMQPPIIDLDNKNCQQDGEEVACFSIVTCITYTGLKTPPEVALSLRWELGAFEKISPRAFFTSGQDTQSKIQTLTKNMKTCSTSIAYITDNLRDKLTPITAKFMYDLINPENPAPKELLPILDQYQSKVHLTQLNLLKNCGEDNVCIPDLAVQAKSMTSRHVLGEDTEVDLMVQVTNVGEDSYLTQVYISMPPGISYINVHKVESKLPVKCVSSSRGPSGDVVTCDIGNPLTSGSLVLFTIRALAGAVNGSSNTLHFTLKANSTNAENSTDEKDNSASITIPVVAIANIRLTGVSKPEQVLFNSTDVQALPVHEQDVGPEIIHLYEVRNIGPSSISALYVMIEWPSFLDGRDFLYLPVTPQVVRGEGSCMAEHVNRLNLTVDERDFDLSVYEALQGVQAAYGGQVQKRSRRNIIDFLEDKNEMTQLTCENGEAECVKVRCEIGQMRKGESVIIQIHARVFVETMVKHRALIVTSQAIAQVMEVPYRVVAEEYMQDTYKIETFVGTLDLGIESRGLKLWIIILSIIGGCLFLLLLIVLLWKCGFFRRLRIEDLEKEKLTNGSNDIQTYTATKSGPHKYDNVPNDQL